MYEKTMNYETMFSPLTPAHRFKKEDLEDLPKKNEIIRLDKMMEEYQKPLKNLDDSNKRLQAQLSLE